MTEYLQGALLSLMLLITITVKYPSTAPVIFSLSLIVSIVLLINTEKIDETQAIRYVKSIATKIKNFILNFQYLDSEKKQELSDKKKGHFYDIYFQFMPAIKSLAVPVFFLIITISSFAYLDTQTRELSLIYPVSTIIGFTIALIILYCYRLSPLDTLKISFYKMLQYRNKQKSEQLTFEERSEILLFYNRATISSQKIETIHLFPNEILAFSNFVQKFGEFIIRSNKTDYKNLRTDIRKVVKELPNLRYDYSKSVIGLFYNSYYALLKKSKQYMDYLSKDGVSSYGNITGKQGLTVRGINDIFELFQNIYKIAEIIAVIFLIYTLYESGDIHAALSTIINATNLQHYVIVNATNTTSLMTH
ncbi:MAG: hypothetical protein KGH69_03285 [Candidatus Micrarchaeota archaeon]|nr:hypothetical protein [Candidatus Micrarchaeota archaeon]